MNLLTIILPVFATIGIGVAARRFEFIEAQTFRGLTDVVFYISMPALLFGAVVAGPPLDLIGVASVYFAACLIVFALGVGAAKVLRLPLANAAMLGLNASYGNTVMMGIPIAVAMLGPQALPPLMAIIALHSAILLPLASVLIELGTTRQQTPASIVLGTIKGTLRNPVIMSIVLAFAWRALGVPVPDALRELLRSLGASATPLALMCLGGTLPRVSGMAVGVEAVLATALKLTVLPALIWGIGTWAQLAHLPLVVAVMTGGMPTGANAFMLARRSEHLLEASAFTVVASTVLSLLTLAVLHYLVL